MESSGSGSNPAGISLSVRTSNPPGIYLSVPIEIPLLSVRTGRPPGIYLSVRSSSPLLSVLSNPAGILLCVDSSGCSIPLNI